MIDCNQTTFSIFTSDRGFLSESQKGVDLTLSIYYKSNDPIDNWSYQV